MKRIAIHGLGYVGLTAAVHWARAGWQVIGYDPDQRTIERLRAGTPRAGEFLGYLDADVKALVVTELPAGAVGCIYPTSDFGETLQFAQVHSIAVPTEKDGVPFDDIVLDLVESLLCRLLAADQPLDILVESTLTPGTIDSVLESCSMTNGELGNKTLAVCPRRDWFADRNSHLGALKRIVGGVNAQSTHRAVALLLTVSPDIEATDYRTAEITKALENAILHTAVALPTELAMNMHDRNVAEALRLATTHPRLMKLFMGAGAGGRCIPLGPKYLLELGGPHELLNQALAVDRHIRMACAQAVAARNCKSALVLGIAYRPDFRDAGLSPGLAIAQHLRRTFGIDAAVHDPMWSADELTNMTGFPVSVLDIESARQFADFDAVVLATPHSSYANLDHGYVYYGHREGSRLRFVLDAQGTWAHRASEWADRGVEYRQLGTPYWLRPKAATARVQ
jgi:nucleotide sugar dehydrogenase